MVHKTSRRRPICVQTAQLLSIKLNFEVGQERRSDQQVGNQHKPSSSFQEMDRDLEKTRRTRRAKEDRVAIAMSAEKAKNLRSLGDSGSFC
jgi:hypothetical protein